ncbi:hypothetical protein WN944_010154 [Citrus x changshan-huyou]
MVGFGLFKKKKISSSKTPASSIQDLERIIPEMRMVLFGDDDDEVTVSERACDQLTNTFFSEGRLRVLILSLPKLESGLQLDAIRVIAGLQRRRVAANPYIASDYMENNLDLIDILLSGYQVDDLALTYGAIARDCIRHQCVAKYVLESDHMKKFFAYLQNPSFEIASDAQATFRELLTRHKSTVSEFLSKNQDWFFQEYNSQLLESPNYITRRHAAKLLGDILQCSSNSAVRDKYVSSLNNLRVVMNLLRDSNRHIQFECFHVFKLFVGNQSKPQEIIRVLLANQSKFLQFFGEFYLDRVNDEQFEADNVVSWTTMISGLATSGDLDAARGVFEQMQTRNVVSWTAMINAYVRNERAQEAFELFQRMQLDNVRPNESTLVSLLQAFKNWESLKLGG